MSEFSTEWINKWRFLNDPIMDTHCVSSKLFERALLKIETQNERIAELEAERRWIPVSERLPEEGQIVIGWNWVSQTVAVVRYHKLTDKFCEYWRGGHMKIIYWQPLPQPPKEGK